MSVEPFDPGALTLKLSEAVIDELLAAAARLDEPGFGLSRERISALSAIARHDAASDWAVAAKPLATERLIQLVRLYTLAETLPGWEAGARSPVIALVRELKQRDEFPAELNTWIRANTDNRFLPYGSLMDRL